MSELLLKISANKILAMDFRPQTLYVFDDHIEYRGNEGVIGGQEVTLAYNQIAEVHVERGIIQSSLSIVNNGGQEDVGMDHLMRADAEKAKELIEAHVEQVGGRGVGPAAGGQDINSELAELGKLLEQGVITGPEYEQRKAQLSGQQPTSLPQPPTNQSNQQ